MSYTTFLGDTFEDEHDEELTRKFGDTYKYFKKQYPELYKLPTEEVRGIFYEFNKSPYGDTVEKSIARTNQYIESHMPDWQEQYINPKAEQSFDDWQGTYPQMQSGRQVSYKTVTPLAFAQEGTQNKFHPYPNTSEYPQYQPNEFLPNGDINFKEVRKRVEKENPVCRQASADLFSQKQSLVNFTKNLYDVYQNAEKLKLEPLHDKYKHAMVNCLAAQHGLDGLSAVSLVSQIKEWNDVRQGINTQEESEQDMVANIIGSYLGSVYPDENCENLLTPYISKQYPYSIK